MLGPAEIVEKTENGAVKSNPGAVISVVLTGGSDAATLILYDNTAASGTKLVTLKAAANTTVPYVPPRSFSFGKGCFAALTGTSPAAYIQYE